MRFAFVIATMVTAAAGFAEPWTGYRGPEHSGISHERGTPARWDLKTGESVNWAVALPGAGGGESSPVVSGDVVIVTAVIDGGKRATIGLDRKTGEEAWRAVIDTPGGTATPTCDATTVYAWHGPGAIAAYAIVDGTERWKASLGAEPIDGGPRPSAVLHEDLLINLVTLGGDIAAIALDKKTGEVVWRAVFKDAAIGGGGSTASPLIVRNEGRDELIVVVPGFVVSLNPQSGREYWRCGGLGDRITASPAVGNETIIATSAGAGPMIAVRYPGADLSGDVAATNRMWRLERTEPTSSSPVIVGDAVFAISEGGEMACMERASGADVWRRPMNVPGPIRAPLIYANLWLYIVDASGEVHIIGANRKHRPIGGGALGEGEAAAGAPAFSEGQMFIRSDKRVYCFGVRRAT